MSEKREQKRLTEAGGRIRALREKHGLNLHELARLCGISASALSLIETGKRDLRVSSLFKIAAALRVTPGEILNDANGGSADCRTGQGTGYDLEEYT